jgi:hypothetical protein
MLLENYSGAAGHQAASCEKKFSIKAQQKEAAGKKYVFLPAAPFCKLRVRGSNRPPKIQ